MVDVPRRDPLNDPTNPEHDAKRLRNVIDSFSTRGDRGGSRWPQPVGNNDRNRAGARSLGGRVSLSSTRRHWHDPLKAAGDAPAGSYQLTYTPLDQPHWPQVFKGGTLQHQESDYTISGRTLTVLSAMKLRTGEDLYCDYDYAPAGAAVVPTPPPPPASPPTAAITGGTASLAKTRTIHLPADIEAGDTILVVGITKNENFVGVTGMPATLSGPADELSQHISSPEHFYLKLWYGVADGSEAGVSVTIQADLDGSSHWLGLFYAVYKDAPTLAYIDGDSDPGPGPYTTPAGSATDGWTVYVVGTGYAEIVKSNPDLVTDQGTVGVQGKLAIFHAVSTQDAETFTSSNTYGWASHVLSVEG